MIKTTKAFLKEINKLGGRKFVSKVLIRDKEYNDDNIIDMSLEESVNPGDNFSLGSVVSNTFEINLINVDDIFENAIIKPYIGLEIDNEIEYIPLGVFTVDEVSKKYKKIKLQCVDNMFNLERAYFSDLSYPANINEILKEICKKADITCNSILPNYSIDEIKGYSFRQAIGIIATLAGCFARFNRLGELEILSYSDTDLRITPDEFFKFETNDKDYIIGKITAKKGEKTFSKGSNTEIIIDNPVITENIVSDLYNKFKDFTYRPYTLSWQGNPAVQSGDRVVIVGVDNKEYNTLIMSHKLTYSGGITSELKATGKTESSDKFDSKGSITQAMENYSIEQAAIKKALIQKASIDDLSVIDARINNLYTQDLTALKANIKDLQSNKISTVEFNATKAEIKTALVSKADINLLNAQGAKINTLEAKTISVETQLAGNLTAKNFHAGAITANSGIIAEGAIGDAEISSLSGNKLRFGTIDTSLVSILGPQGRLKLQGNKLQVFDNSNGKLFERVMLGVDDNNNSSLILRGADGKTVLLNQDGLTKEGITEGFGKVADNSLDAKKFDKNSLVREVNGATETIKGTRVQIGDRTLDIELSRQNNTITEHSKELSTQKATIQALDKAIKLKVDNQTFTQSTENIKGNINSLNSDLVNKIDTSLNNAKADATNKANNALNSAKEFTTAQITTTNSNLSKATSEINILKEQINTKVGQVDIDKSIQDIKFGGRNLFAQKYLGSHGCIMSKLDNPYMSIPTYNIIVDNSDKGNNFGFKLLNSIKINGGKGISFTLSFNYFINKYLNNHDLSMMGYIRIYYEDSTKEDFNFNPKIANCNDKSNWGKWKKLIFTFTTDKNKEIDNIGLLYFYTDYASNGTNLDFTIPKLEIGNRATDYTQAIEDIGQEIADNIKIVTDKISTVESNFIQVKNSIEANVRDLNSTTQTITTNLTNKIDTVNTKVSNAESSINILKNQISNKVSQTDIDNFKTSVNDKITTVTEKINTVESTFTQKTNNINASVSDVRSILSKKADGSTVSSIQSQLASLNIGVDGIRAEVANKTDKGSIISAINQSAEEIQIDASKIKLNGLTTFASKTGLKAIEIESNNIHFYDWEGSERKDSVGHLFSTRTDNNVNKPGIAIGNEKNATFDIVYRAENNNNLPYITFDKNNVLGRNFPILLHENISLNNCILYLGDTKRNWMYQSADGDFCIRTAHGLKILDKDNGSYTADLDANYTGFGKWNQDFFYAKFFPGGFDFVGNDGKSLFWLNDGSWDIWTKKGVNMRIQGDLSVNGKKNRIVETSIGNLALNAVESTECLFTDMSIEQNRTDSNGDCIIWFDNKFLLTVNTKYRYKIDVTPIGEFASNGKLTYVRVVEKTERYFKVRGTPNTLFDWTITAKQIGYENIRLEKVEKAS